MTNLEEGNNRLASSGANDDVGELADTGETLLAGPLTDVAQVQLAADAVGLKEEGVHGSSNICPVGVDPGLAAHREHNLSKYSQLKI